jgi:carboxyl-terminal processing protease
LSQNTCMIRVWLIGFYLCFSVAVASPASELATQFYEFVSEYHVDADSLDLGLLKTRVNNAVQERCGNDQSCPVIKIYSDLIEITQKLDTASQFVAQPDLERIRLEQLGDSNLDVRYALGIELRENIVYRVLSGSSAFEVGLKRGDKILGMTRENRPWNIAQNSFPDAAPVTVRLERAAQTFDLTIIPASGLLMGLLTPEGRMLENNTAYIRIPSFKVIGTAQKVHNLLSNLASRGATQLILDLRFNTGGYLDETLLTLSAFFQGDILKMRSRKAMLTYTLKNGVLEAIGNPSKTSLEFPALFKGKIVVLVNAQTSSAAEVMALIWQRVSYTKFVGEISAGRSRYATLPLRLLEGSQLQLAVIRHLYLSQEPLLEKLTPDLIVTDDLQALNKGTDLLLEAGLGQLKAP